MSESSSVAKRRRTVWRWLVLCLALVAGVCIWWFTKTQTPSSGRASMSWATAKVPVRTVSVQQGSIDQSLSAIGTAVPMNTVAVRSQVDGELIDVLFRDGQQVNAGDVLARIDPRTYKVQRDQAQAQLAQTQAQLNGAQAELKRHKVLFEQNSISRQALEIKETAVQQLRAQLQANQAEIARTQLQLDHTDIVAPISGRLGLRRLDRGNLISAANADGLVTISQVAPIAVEFSLPQSQLSLLTERMRASDAPISVSLSDRQGQSTGQKGHILALDNQIDVATGSLRIKAEFPNQDDALFPNQFVNVQVLLGREQGLLIPSYAMQRGSLGTFVYVVGDDNKVKVQTVSPGIMNSDSTQILEGLQAGERVVVDGVDRLREGSTVEIMEHDGLNLEPEPDQNARPATERSGRSAGRGSRTGP